jgi:hypothetical protein
MEQARKRRIVTYDLDAVERQAVKDAAEREKRTISRWVADTIRARVRREKHDRPTED